MHRPFRARCYARRKRDSLTRDLQGPRNVKKLPTSTLRYQDMSGFEVAGIVLGALPLIFYAFEHYSECVSGSRKKWREG